MNTAADPFSRNAETFDANPTNTDSATNLNSLRSSPEVSKTVFLHPTAAATVVTTNSHLHNKHKANNKSKSKVISGMGPGYEAKVNLSTSLEPSNAQKTSDSPVNAQNSQLGAHTMPGRLPEEPPGFANSSTPTMTPTVSITPTPSMSGASATGAATSDSLASSTPVIPRAVMNSREGLYVKPDPKISHDALEALQEALGSSHLSALHGAAHTEYYDPCAGGRSTLIATHHTKLFVGQIPPNYDPEQISRLFGQFGRVVEFVVLRSKASKAHKGSAFCTYDNPASAYLAIHYLHDRYQIDGARRPLVLKVATNPAENLTAEPKSKTLVFSPIGRKCTQAYLTSQLHLINVHPTRFELKRESSIALGKFSLPDADLVLRHFNGKHDPNITGNDVPLVVTETASVSPLSNSSSVATPIIITPYSRQTGYGRQIVIPDAVAQGNNTTTNNTRPPSNAKNPSRGASNTASHSRMTPISFTPAGAASMSPQPSPAMNGSVFGSSVSLGPSATVGPSQFVIHQQHQHPSQMFSQNQLPPASGMTSTELASQFAHEKDPKRYVTAPPNQTQHFNEQQSTNALNRQVPRAKPLPTPKSRVDATRLKRQASSINGDPESELSRHDKGDAIETISGPDTLAGSLEQGKASPSTFTFQTQSLGGQQHSTDHPKSQLHDNQQGIDASRSASFTHSPLVVSHSSQLFALHLNSSQSTSRTPHSTSRQLGSQGAGLHEEQDSYLLSSRDRLGSKTSIMNYPEYASAGWAGTPAFGAVESAGNPSFPQDQDVEPDNDREGSHATAESVSSSANVSQHTSYQDVGHLSTVPSMYSTLTLSPSPQARSFARNLSPVWYNSLNPTDSGEYQSVGASHDQLQSQSIVAPTFSPSGLAGQTQLQQDGSKVYHVNTQVGAYPASDVHSFTHSQLAMLNAQEGSLVPQYQMRAAQQSQQQPPQLAHPHQQQPSSSLPTQHRNSLGQIHQGRVTLHRISTPAMGRRLGPQGEQSQPLASLMNSLVEPQAQVPYTNQSWSASTNASIASGTTAGHQYSGHLGLDSGSFVVNQSQQAGHTLFYNSSAQNFLPQSVYSADLAHQSVQASVHFPTSQQAVALMNVPMQGYPSSQPLVEARQVHSRDSTPVDQTHLQQPVFSPLPTHPQQTLSQSSHIPLQHQYPYASVDHVQHLTNRLSISNASVPQNPVSVSQPQSHPQWVSAQVSQVSAPQPRK